MAHDAEMMDTLALSKDVSTKATDKLQYEWMNSFEYLWLS